ncbi:MAG: hypothetical protein WCV93_05635 [Candidatus Shapirobacteria bacterium]|jgi:hypothetical protein
MTLLYAFSNPWGTNISHLTAIALAKAVPKDIKNKINFQLIPSYPQPFFRKYIQNNQYDLIIGLGDGMKFLQTIKIETRAINSYCHQSINPLLPIYLDLSLPPVDNFDSRQFSIGTNMGSYNCNWIAFQTQYVINTKYPKTKHLFLHLPPRASAITLATNLISFFHANRLLSV